MCTLQRNSFVSHSQTYLCPRMGRVSTEVNFMNSKIRFDGKLAQIIFQSPYPRMGRMSTEVYFTNRKIRFNGKLAPIMIKAADFNSAHHFTGDSYNIKIYLCLLNHTLWSLRGPQAKIYLRLNHTLWKPLLLQCWFSFGCSFSSGSAFSLLLLLYK